MNRSNQKTYRCDYCDKRFPFHKMAEIKGREYSPNRYGKRNKCLGCFAKLANGEPLKPFEEEVEFT